MALRIDDPKGLLQPYSNNMPFPGQIDPTGRWAPAQAQPPSINLGDLNRGLMYTGQSFGPGAATARPNINVPVGQVAQTPQPGNGNLWDALRALFSGQPSAPQGQGMTGMLQPRGQAGAGTDALGNPFNRFG